MQARRTRAIRPNSELMEGRLLTAAFPSMRAAMAERAMLRNRPIDPALRTPPRRAPGVTVPGPHGPKTTIGAGFLGNQGPRIGRPPAPVANVNYGLITITNTTQATITLSVSASTYENGRFADFTLKAGQSQVYFSRFGGPFNSAPSFQASFDTVERRNVIQLAEVKTVYASTRWTPTDPSLGQPYAIIADAGGLNIVPVS